MLTARQPRKSGVHRQCPHVRAHFAIGRRTLHYDRALACSPMSRTPLIAGNWKMHKTTLEAEDFVAAFLPKVQGLEGVDLALCAPFTALGPLIDSTRGTKLTILAQNVHEDASGAFT